MVCPYEFIRLSWSIFASQVEDYFKAGQWQNALMLMDLQLFLAHREESGAGEPPALEQLKLPTLPEAGQIVLEGQVNQVNQVNQVKESRAIMVTPVLPQAETLQILIFVNKHGLDLTKTKALLAPLKLSVREPLMSDFNPGEPLRETPPKPRGRGMDEHDIRDGLLVAS